MTQSIDQLFIDDETYNRYGIIPENGDPRLYPQTYFEQGPITQFDPNPEASIATPLTLEDVQKHKDPMEAVAVAKGVVQGTLGLPGDMLGLVSGLVNMIPTIDGKGWIQPEGKSWTEASHAERFQAGMNAAPLTTEDISGFLDEGLKMIGVDVSQFKTGQTAGEFVAPGKAIEVGTKTIGKALNKAKGK